MTNDWINLRTSLYGDSSHTSLVIYENYSAMKGLFLA